MERSISRVRAIDTNNVTRWFWSYATSSLAVIRSRTKRTRLIWTRRRCFGVFRYADHDEVFLAGDAYYGAPGHLPSIFAGTVLVEFSPTDALNQTMSVVGANLEASKPAGQP